MTLLLSGRRLLTPRQPFSPLCVSGLSSDRYLRVPPTGIPRPDEEDAPTGSGCPLWRAIGAVGLALAAYDPSRYGVVMGVVRRVASNTTQPENAMPFY